MAVSAPPSSRIGRNAGGQAQDYCDHLRGSGARVGRRDRDADGVARHRSRRRRERRRQPPAAAGGSPLARACAAVLLLACAAPIVIWGSRYPPAVLEYWLAGGAVAAIAFVVASRAGSPRFDVAARGAALLA